MERTNNFDIHYPEIINLRKNLPILCGEQAIINLAMRLNPKNAFFIEMINRPQGCSYGIFEFVVVIAVKEKEFRHTRKEKVDFLFQSKNQKSVMSEIVDDVYNNILEAILIEGVNVYDTKLLHKTENEYYKRR